MIACGNERARTRVLVRMGISMVRHPAHLSEHASTYLADEESVPLYPRLDPDIYQGVFYIIKDLASPWNDENALSEIVRVFVSVGATALCDAAC
jgi:hypothetical protein